MAQEEPSAAVAPAPPLSRSESVNEILDSVTSTADDEIRDKEEEQLDESPKNKRRLLANINRLSMLKDDYDAALNSSSTAEDLAGHLDKLDVNDAEVRFRALKTTGTGSSKKKAKTEAAHEMLKLLHVCDTQIPMVQEGIKHRLDRLDQNTAGVLTAVSLLQEYCQEHGRHLPKYEEGPAYGTTFNVLCYVEGHFARPPPDSPIKTQG